MSNYTFIVCSRRLEQRLEGWLQAHGSAEQIHRVQLGTWNTLFVIAAGVGDAVSEGVFVKGTVNSALDGAIAFGLDGWNAAPASLRTRPDEHGGEYCVATWSREGVDILRDVFGNARLVTSAGQGYAIVSDSVLVTAAIRRALGGSLTANERSLLARTIRHSSASQQLSGSTMFEEIEFVPPGFNVSIDRRLTVTRRGRPLTSRYGATEPGGYRDAIRELACDVAGLIGAYASVPGWTTALSLSGGYDSRAVYAAARAIGLPASIRFESVNSAAVHAADHRAATGLTAALGMLSVDPRPEDAKRSADPLETWASTLLDVYDGFGPASPDRLRPRHFRMTGIGAALLKGGWDWRSWAGLTETFPPSPARDAYASEAEAGLQLIGMSADTPHSAEHHYASYRNALHASAGHLGVHMTGVHPLQQMRSAVLGFSDLPEAALRSPLVIVDLIVLLDAASALQPFDVASRSIDRSLADHRLAELGGGLDRRSLNAFSAYGDPGRMGSGPSTLALSAARSIGASGSVSQDRIAGLAAAGLARLPAGLIEAYTELQENALWRIGKVDGDVRAAGAPAARIASLAALSLL